MGEVLQISHGYLSPVSIGGSRRCPSCQFLRASLAPRQVRASSFRARDFSDFSAADRFSAEAPVHSSASTTHLGHGGVSMSSLAGNACSILSDVWSGTSAAAAAHIATWPARAAQDRHLARNAGCAEFVVVRAHSRRAVTVSPHPFFLSHHHHLLGAYPPTSQESLLSPCDVREPQAAR